MADELARQMYAVSIEDLQRLVRDRTEFEETARITKARARKWEYATVSFPGPPRGLSLEVHASERGGGWELVSVLVEDGVYIAYFKREMMP